MPLWAVGKKNVSNGGGEIKAISNEDCHTSLEKLPSQACVVAWEIPHGSCELALGEKPFWQLSSTI